VQIEIIHSSQMTATFKTKLLYLKYQDSKFDIINTLKTQSLINNFPLVMEYEGLQQLLESCFSHLNPIHQLSSTFSRAIFLWGLAVEDLCRKLLRYSISHHSHACCLFILVSSLYLSNLITYIGSLRRADHSSRGVLPTVSCRCV
jgi:hypothetical protein